MASADLCGFKALSPLVRNRSVTPTSPKLSALMPPIIDHNIANHTHSLHGDGLPHAKTYYNPAKAELYSRFAPHEWEESNRKNFGLSERERSIAERLRTDCFQTLKQADSRTRERQSSNTKKLADRRDDIGFWKSELNKEIRLMENEIENLSEHARVLHKAYQDTKSPLAVAEKCLLAREGRHGIDQVSDEVESALSREIDVIKRCQDKMRRLIEKTHIQLKLDKAAQNACESDAKDKHHAQNLDDLMHQLHNTSEGLQYYPGIENEDNTITDPYSWVKFTQENIARSQKEREASEKLRGYIDSLLRACANQMWAAFNNVNNALQARVQETQDAKNKLQSHLYRVNNEIADMSRSIALLKKAIFDKEAPLKLAMTRLKERTRRRNVELCHDPPMKGLIREVHEIRDSIKFLKDKLQSAEEAMRRLSRTKRTLEKDISVKENSLEIDARNCTGMRKSMAMDPKVGPIFNMPCHM